jgi:hypothetical protein
MDLEAFQAACSWSPDPMKDDRLQLEA